MALNYLQKRKSTKGFFSIKSSNLAMNNNRMFELFVTIVTALSVLIILIDLVNNFIAWPEISYIYF